VLNCGKKSAVQVVDNPIAHSKMKHVELHAHYLKQLVQDNVVDFVYCKIDDQFTNIFTKPLSKAKFVKIRAMLRL
jgi:hypothetical protein